MFTFAQSDVSVFRWINIFKENIRHDITDITQSAAFSTSLYKYNIIYAYINFVIYCSRRSRAHPKIQKTLWYNFVSDKVPTVCMNNYPTILLLKYYNI